MVSDRKKTDLLSHSKNSLKAIAKQIQEIAF